jgi:hypothetical protein
VSFITWTAIPVPQQSLLSLEEGLIPNDLTVKMGLKNPFNKERDIPDKKNPNRFEAVGGLPVYEFGFKDAEVTDIVSTEEIQIFDQIVISPNPYYENSQQGQSDSVVRLTNLPQCSVVTVYTLEGKFIKRFNERTGLEQELEGNLNDSNGVRISGGLYIIHIAVPHLGIQRR